MPKFEQANGEWAWTQDATNAVNTITETGISNRFHYVKKVSVAVSGAATAAAGATVVIKSGTTVIWKKAVGTTVGAQWSEDFNDKNELQIAKGADMVAEAAASGAAGSIIHLNVKGRTD